MSVVARSRSRLSALLGRRDRRGSVDEVGRRGLVGLVVLALGAALVLLPAGADADEERVRRVPADYPTIQEAVDAANPGDLVLLGPGVYHEAVEVPRGKDWLVIRGTDRNTVILDGRDEDGEVVFDNGITIRSNHVAVENLTARYYGNNGIYWTGVHGFYGRWLTAYNIRLYAIYAFDSVNGVFEDSYASGSEDASFYIGQCDPCLSTLQRVVGEYSALGYSGTNATGVLIRDSDWNRNLSGIAPNSLDGQRFAPQRGSTIVNNRIRDSGTVDTPTTSLTGAIRGAGVALAGATGNLVEGNEITGSTQWGVVIFPLPDASLWVPYDNVVRDNVLRDNGSDPVQGHGDLAVAYPSGTGNCFEGNEFETSAPPQIEESYPCDGTGLNAVDPNGDMRVTTRLASDYAQAQAGTHPRPSYMDMPEPGPQENMPGDPERHEPFTQRDADGETVETGDDPDDGDERGSTGKTATPATGAGIGMTLLGAALIGSAWRARRRTS